VEDAAGNVLASAFSSSFTTAAAPPQDTTAPTVTSVNPATGASGVNAGISVQVTFSEAMDASTINGSQIRLRDSAGNVVAASVAYDSGNRSATLDPNSNLAYATSFTVSVEGVKDVAGNSLSGSFTSTFSTAAAPGAPGQFIVTPYDKIPSFGSNPTIVSASSGSWSNPSTWSTGVVPAANDIVSIAAGTTVTFDVVMTAADAVQTVAVQAGGKLTFRTDVNTTLFVSNLLVMTDGELNVGAVANPVAAAVKAQIIFANKPLDTTYDPEQYGNGLIALGKVTMVGAAKPDTFIRLAAEAFAGQTTLRLSQPATGWQVGDKLILPDSHQVTDFERNTNYQNQLEQPTISAISGDGLTITLSAPLAYNHLGARGINGSLDFLPHVANTSRSVVVRSESASGNRGHVLFTYRADVNVQYVQFAGLGRTRNSADDNTTFGSSGTVTHVGTNQEDRNPVQFRHLFGPTTPQANGFQYTFVGNSVTCPLNPMPFIWGINVNDSHYGLLKDNVLFNWAGASFVTKTGSETGNVIDHNMVVRTTGNALREDDDARAGSGFWFRGPNNYVRNNVATNINSDGDDIYNYGFNFYGRYVGTVNIPVAQGSDLSVASQRQARNMNNTPILQFENNEVYGATTSGLSLWWIGTFDDNFYADAQESVVKGFTVWHHGTTGLFSYPVNRVTLDGMVVRGNVNNLSDPNFHPMGIFFSDYMGHQLVVRNANIQGVATGIVTPYNVGRVSTMNTNVIENSYLANVVNISVSPPRSINGSGDLSPKRLEIRNVTFAHPTNVSPSRWADIDMDFVISDNSGTSNLNVADLVFVYDYNGNANDDFQVFYTERAPADAVIRSLIRGRVKSI
jgi:hypothetical protein